MEKWGHGAEGVVLVLGWLVWVEGAARVSSRREAACVHLGGGRVYVGDVGVGCQDLLSGGCLEGGADAGSCVGCGVISLCGSGAEK